MDGLYDHVGNVRLAQVKRSGAGFVQQSIMATNASPELSAGFGKTRWRGRLSWRHQVRKTGCPIS
jgi:hypothetical protein